MTIDEIRAVDKEMHGVRLEVDGIMKELQPVMPLISRLSLLTDQLRRIDTSLSKLTKNPKYKVAWAGAVNRDGEKVEGI